MLKLAEPCFGEDALAAVGRVLSSGHLTQGPVVGAFEEAIASFCGVEHAIATTSATTALELALAAHDVGPGDEVLAADFTYPATGNAVLQRGATLRLIDVDMATYCIDAEALADVLTPKTRAVIAVDVFGLPADYAALEAVLGDHDIALICDAACSLGGAIGKRRTGGFGSASCFSFHPRKSLTTGEGGMVTTDDQELAKRMQMLRNHGSERSGWRSSFVEPGFNYRMSDINAALGLFQVPQYANTVEVRRNLAHILTERIAGMEAVAPQMAPDGFFHPYQAYVVTLDSAIDRDAVIACLRESGVESTLGTYALHTEPAFLERGCAPAEGLPRSAALARRTLALPLHERLTENDMERIGEAFERAVGLCGGSG